MDDATDWSRSSNQIVFNPNDALALECRQRFGEDEIGRTFVAQKTNDSEIFAGTDICLFDGHHPVLPNGPHKCLVAFGFEPKEDDFGLASSFDHRGEPRGPRSRDFHGDGVLTGTSRLLFSNPR